MMTEALIVPSRQPLRAGGMRGVETIYTPALGGKSMDFSRVSGGGSAGFIDEEMDVTPLTRGEFMVGHSPPR